MSQWTFACFHYQPIGNKTYTHNLSCKWSPVLSSIYRLYARLIKSWDQSVRHMLHAIMINYRYDAWLIWFSWQIYLPDGLGFRGWRLSRCNDWVNYLSVLPAPGTYSCSKAFTSSGTNSPTTFVPFLNHLFPLWAAFNANVFMPGRWISARATDL